MNQQQSVHKTTRNQNPYYERSAKDVEHKYYETKDEIIREQKYARDRVSKLETVNKKGLF